MTRWPNFVTWPENWPDDPDYWRHLQVACYTGDFDSLITSLLAEAPYLGLG